MAYKKNAGRRQKIKSHLSPLMHAAAEGGAAQLKENLSGSSGRTGIIRDGKPSSFEGEFPTERTSQLKDSVGVQQVSETRFLVGTGIAQPEDIGKQTALEFGSADGRLGPRAYALRTFHNEATHKRLILRQLKKADSCVNGWS